MLDQFAGTEDVELALELADGARASSRLFAAMPDDVLALFTQRNFTTNRHVYAGGSQRARAGTILSRLWR